MKSGLNEVRSTFALSMTSVMNLKQVVHINIVDGAKKFEKHDQAR